jgi:hypothetical protein
LGLLKLTKPAALSKLAAVVKRMPPRS